MGWDTEGAEAEQIPAMAAKDRIEPPFQVVITSQKETANGSPAAKRRLLTVDEALKFSPITSTTSFGLECFPFPQVGQRSSSAPLTSASTRQSVYQSLSNHVRQQEIQQNGNSPLQTVAHEVKQLLDQGNLTEFAFNFPPSRRQRPNAEATSNRPRPSFREQLSPWASMLLDVADVPYRCPRPDVLGPESTKAQFLPTPNLSHSSDQALNARNKVAYRQNTSVTPAQQKPMVVVPSLPSSSQREYVTVLPSPRKEDPRGSSGHDNLALKIQAQKDEADATLLKLQDFLHEIFEAEDQLEPDTSVTTRTAISNLFESLSFGSEYQFLTTKTHGVLQKTLRKLVEFSQLYDIPSDYLQRLQRICEVSIFATKDLDIGVHDSMSDGDSTTWEAKLRAAENGLASSCTFVWTVLGSVSKKELCPEDVVQCLPSILESTIEDCLIPIVEARPSGKDAELFKGAIAAKAALTRLASHCRKFLDLLVRLCLQMDGLTDVVSKLEYIAAKLIFVENAHADKDSALGFQVYEAIRRSAMDVLAKLFSRYEADREDILFQISQNLEKLPTTKQSARQFKLSDGHNIQLLSALLMLLVQATSLETPRRLSKSRRKLASASVEVDGLDFETELPDLADGDTNNVAGENHASFLSLQKLRERMNALDDNARHSAQFIVNFFLDKATMPKATKTGEEPYRNLLDLFVQDLIVVLASTDWPASELLLRILAAKMLKYAADAKATANVKNMALELLSWFGSAISKSRNLLQQTLAQKEENADDCDRYLQGLADDYLMGAIRMEDLVVENGPFRIAIEYLQDRDVDNLQIGSAKSYHILQWGHAVVNCFSDDGNDNGETDEEIAQLAHFINRASSDPRWLEMNSDFENVATSQGRLAYLITVLNSDFCRALDKILRVSLLSISSDQAKTRSRSLKSVVTMLEADPKLLDRDLTIMRVIFRCASDSSPMVRDSALSLIGKCMALKPALEEEGCDIILKALADSTPGVRKRCLSLLKEIYLRCARKPLRTKIMEAFLLRVKDLEESVSSLARQIIEELWFTPLLTELTLNEDSAQSKVAIAEQTNLLIENVQYNDELLPFLEAFLRSFLSESSKAAASSFYICKALVAEIFYRVANSSDPNHSQTQAALLKTLTAFAKVKSRLVVPDQLQTLQPYISNLATGEDLFLFRSVVIIFRCTLPHLSVAQKPMLMEIQDDLFKSIARLARAELNEVMACLWTINGVLKNTDRLANLAVSVLRGIQSLKGSTFVESLTVANGQKNDTGRIKTYTRIIGCIGKHCDLESHQVPFKRAFSSWQGDSVAGLLADSVCPFTLEDQPHWLRTTAMESLGAICQSWPGQFNKERIRSSLSVVFKGNEGELQNTVLKTFAEFFGIREDATEAFSATGDAVHGEDLGRLGGSLHASEHDSAASLIAQHFLNDILKVAVSRLDNYGLVATQVIASINRQGLVHPKECAAALVALETAPVSSIAKVAFESHSLLHHQHESMFEREYMRAIHGAFQYQKNLVKEPAGATTRPYTAKLASLFELVKTSNAKYVRKFLSNLILRANFELSTLEISGNIPDHVLFARFISQNLAFFEYGKVDELLSAISCIENVVGKTGADVAQAIETKILGVTFVQTDHSGELFVENGVHAGHEEPRPNVNPKEAKQLTTAAMILSMLWEVRVHLRRQYSPCLEFRRDGKSKDSKEMARAPTKAHGIFGEKLWDNISSIMSSLDSEEKMMARCRDFATLMNIDDEVRVAAENDDLRDDYSVSVEPDENLPMMDGERPSMKRKGPSSLGGTPKKKRGRPGLKDRRLSGAGDSGGNWD